MKLRKYQREAVRGAEECLHEHGSALLHMATGTGKTVVFSKIIERRIAGGERCLVLAHRKELIEQARARMIADNKLHPMMVGVEQAENTSSPAQQVIVGSVATMVNRLHLFPPDTFGLVVVDEAHHAPARTYGRILRHFSSADLLGVTATPERLDGKGLQKWFHPRPAYTYEIRDAIDEGYLVPVYGRIVFVDSVDLSKVKVTAGDLDEGQLDEVLMDEENLHGMARPAVEISGDRPCLVFANTVAHAYALQKAIDLYAGRGSARALDGSSPGELRSSTLDDHKAGRFQYLINCALFTEGVDLPHVSCVVMAKPTQSRALYCQMAGRGTRLLGRTFEESVAAGKSDLLIVDLVGNAGQHNLVCSLQVLDGSLDEDVLKRAKKKALREVVEIEGALEVAEKEEVAQRRLQLTEKADVKYRVIASDQFSILGVVPKPGRWGGAEQTPAQAKILERAGIKDASKLDRGQASQVIDKIFARRDGGLCTLKQAKFVAKYGLNPDMSFEDAGAAISRIVDNNYRLPPGLLDEMPHLAASKGEPSDDDARQAD